MNSFLNSPQPYLITEEKKTPNKGINDIMKSKAVYTLTLGISTKKTSTN